MSDQEPKEIGRPSKYDPKYCQMLIDDMSIGFSFEAFAGLVGVSKDTLYEWVKVYPEFSDAKKEAFEKSRRFWEKTAIDNLVSKSTFNTETMESHKEVFNQTVYIFNMKNRFPTEWRDRKEFTGAGGKPLIPVQVVVNIPDNNRKDITDEDDNIEGSQD